MIPSKLYHTTWYPFLCFVHKTRFILDPVILEIEEKSTFGPVWCGVVLCISTVLKTQAETGSC